MESQLDISIVGNYSIKQANFNDNCKICHKVDFADVLINGICGKCLLSFWKKHHKKECLDCEWQGSENDLISRYPYLKECDYEYCPQCESDNIADVEDKIPLSFTDSSFKREQIAQCKAEEQSL